MKKELTGRLIVLLLLCLGLYGGYRYAMLNRVMGAAAPENALTPMVMVDGMVWQLSEESESGFSRSPDGTIREIIGNEIPTENGQANFGAQGMPYWHLTDGLMVYVNGNYFIMTNLQE